MRGMSSAPLGGSKQNRRSASEWRALVRAFSRSGVTRKQYCARHGVAISTFDWWRSRLRREPSTPTLSSASPSSALFVELTPEEKPVGAVASGWDVELELGRGMFLRLRRAAC